MTTQVLFNSKEVFAGNTVAVTVRVRPPSQERLIEIETKLGKLTLFFKENSKTKTKPITDLSIVAKLSGVWLPL